MTGYMHPGYAESLAEFGTPRKLPRCKGWILERQIPGFSCYDAMGCYPLFVCKDWSQLQSELTVLENDLISLSLVTDPFGQYDSNLLQQCFDVMIPFKEHFVTNLSKSLSTIVSAHNRYYARKSLRNICVERCQDPAQFTDEWTDLYGILVKRHDLKGIKAFSRVAFAKQLSIPGIVMVRAVHQDVVVGAQIWFVQGEVGYSHLTAISEAGYKLRASYALYWFAIEYFSDKLRWLDLGAGAGSKSDGKDGLSEFKRGWSTDSRTVYFCGRIFDPERYTQIVKAKGIAATDYFPAYRRGEFG